MAIPGVCPPKEWIDEEEQRCANLSGVTLEDFRNKKLPEENSDNRWKKIFAKVVYKVLGEDKANKFNFFPKEGTYEYYAENAVRETYKSSPDIIKEVYKHRKQSLKYIDDVYEGKNTSKPVLGYKWNWDSEFKNRLYNLCSKYGGTEVDNYVYFLAVLIGEKTYYESYPFVWDRFEEDLLIF